MLVIERAFGVPVQQANHIVILSTLPAHALPDHPQRATPGHVPGAGDRLPAGRA